MKNHVSVMLNESINSLNIKKNGIYLDLTLGLGGHSQKILQKLSSKGLLIGFDKDKLMIDESEKKLKLLNKNFKLIHSDFKNVKKELEKINVFKVDGILADLGVSSPQIDNPKRGFSYSKNGKLDMRMDQTQDLNAYKIVNDYPKNEIIKIFKNYGEFKLANKVAQKIIENRPIEKTLELVSLIKESLPAAIIRKKNPAKMIFQAIRIEVNNELDSLKKILEDCPSLLKKEGRFSIITFHSLEDKIVKTYFKKLIEDKTGKLPIILEKKWDVKTKKPSNQEIKLNNRSRSAKLRTLIKRKEKHD